MTGIERTSRPEDESDLQALLRLAGARAPVPAERTARVRAAVHEKWRAARRAERRVRVSGMLAAFGTAAALFLALPGGRAPAPSTPVADVERLSGSARVVQPETRASVPLAEGDVLVAGSVLDTSGRGRAALRAGRLTVRVDRDTRLVLLGPHALELERGAVYVDSGGEVAALEVRTPEGIVHDVGTRFEVRAGPGSLRLRVREGEVLLQRTGSSDRAVAGTELRVEGGRLTRRAVSPFDSDWAWAAAIAPAFELEGRRLSDFLDWYARETGRAWRLAPGLEPRKDTILHGSVADLTPDEALQAVLPTCGLASRIEGDTLKVVAAPVEARR